MSSVRDHYERVTQAWTLLLGEELHYGVFRSQSESLEAATKELTRLMTSAVSPAIGQVVLDVGCGTGAPACHLAQETGASVLGITTSEVGIEAARARALAGGLNDLVTFEKRNGMDNGLESGSFDGVLALESSHLMRKRDRLVAECARVLRPGGRFALCDIVLGRPIPFGEVRRLLEPLSLLRRVFGDARMEPVAEYRQLCTDSGLVLEQEVDLTAATRPTFSRWRENALVHHDALAEMLGENDLGEFVKASEVLEDLWDDGTMGYALIAASKPV